MDSNAIQPLIQTAQTVLMPTVFAAIGKLQARFVREENVLLLLCQELARISQSNSVMLVDIQSVGKAEMPENAACWCHDS
ncbi:MAG: hybrid sensor histidine kinase/response regulator, partial [Shewanella sp.]|nr:hybrid sensor histidine kinase/response regulator [Shewanella sp.]